MLTFANVAGKDDRNESHCRVFSMSALFHRLIAGSTVAALVAVGLSANQAYAAETNQSVPSYDECISKAGVSTPAIDTKLICRVVSVGDHLRKSQNGKLTTDLTDQELVNQYNFSSGQISDFHAILNGTYEAPQGRVIYASRDARILYLSNADLKAGTFAVLATAAEAGPAALEAAWIGLSSAMGGPFGTVAGIVTGVLGGTFFADLALKITGALVQGKGVAFYTKWGVPPLYTKIQ